MLMQPDSNHGQYDFILNNQAPKKSLFSGGSKNTRLLFIVVVVLVLIVLFWVLLAVLNGGKKAGVDELVGIAQDQTEIARLATAGSTAARSTDTRGFATTTALSINTSQKDLLDIIKKHGRKLSTKDLALKHSAETDQDLNSAAENNRYDEVFKQTMRNELADYQQALKTAYANSTNIGDKQQLDTMYKQASLLLTKTQ